MISPLPGWRLARAGAAGAVLGDCSLVVATHRRPDDVVHLLDALRGAAPPPAEVAVVDGSPDDATEAAVRGWAEEGGHAFDLLYVRSPAGLTRQRNVGIDATGGRFVFFLDDDCVPEPDYFRQVRRVFAGDGEGKVGGVGGSPVNEMGLPLSRRWRVRFLLRLIPRGESGTYYPIASSVPRSMVAPFRGCRRVDVLPGCAMAFRREVLERERFSYFFEGYAQGEDLEFSLRVRRRWLLLWCGDARLVHNFSPAGRPDPWRKGRMEVRNRHFIWKRHTPGIRAGDRLRFWADIAYVFSYDLAGCLLKPSRARWWLPHAAGVAAGAVGCLVSPPRHPEPAARREYEVRLPAGGPSSARLVPVPRGAGG